MIHTNPARRPLQYTGPGVPYKLNVASAATIVSALQAGKTMEDAAEAARIKPKTLYRWLDEAKRPDAPAALVTLARQVVRILRERAAQPIPAQQLAARRAPIEAVVPVTLPRQAGEGLKTRRITRTLLDGTVEVILETFE